MKAVGCRALRPRRPATLLFVIVAVAPVPDIAPSPGRLQGPLAHWPQQVSQDMTNDICHNIALITAAGPEAASARSPPWPAPGTLVAICRRLAWVAPSSRCDLPAFFSSSMVYWVLNPSRASLMRSGLAMPPVARMRMLVYAKL